MKTLVLTAILFGAAYCARLDNSYLPPNQRSAGFGGAGGAGFGGPSGAGFGGAGGAGFGRSGGSSFGGSGDFGGAAGRKVVPILKFNADNNGEGSYRYNYETGNSISAEEQGEARGDGTKAHGSYSYISPEGERISITYTADQNGYVAQGSHIPTPPPIPEAILKSLQENAAAEARGVYDDGQYRGEGLQEGQYQGGAGGSSGAFQGYKY